MKYYNNKVIIDIDQGYKKSEDDPRKWVIDEPAALVVKKSTVCV